MKIRIPTMRSACRLVIPFWLMWATDLQAIGFDCKKAKSQIEQMICNSYSKEQDDELDIAYQWALMRVKDKQKLVKEQRHWLKNIRNTCPDSRCLSKVYQERLETLAALVKTSGCYVLKPVMGSGNVLPIEPVCEAMEKNLNRFCDQPPVVCGLKIAPEFQEKIILPQWTPIDHPEGYLGLIEEFIRAPRQDSSLPQQRKDLAWEEERPEIEQALAENRLSFSKATLDLYNLGKPQTAYRLDPGDCQTLNPQLSDRKQWGNRIELMHTHIKTQFAPEVVRPLFKQYFPLSSAPLNDIFIFGGKTYSYVMGYSSNLPRQPGENGLWINRHERWINPGNDKVRLTMNNICFISYQPR